MSVKLEEIENLKTTLKGVTKRGFSYYLKNIALLVLVAVAVMIFKDPQILSNPSAILDYFSTPDGIRGVIVCIAVIVGIYALLRSIISDDTAATRVNDEIQKQKEHSENMNYRMSIHPAINTVLNSLILELGCENASVFEFHNGTQNLVNIPFVFADRNYEVNSPDNEFPDDITDFNLTRFPFFSAHINQTAWQGTVKEIESEDKRLGSRLRNNGYTFISGATLHNLGNPIGFMTVGFKGNVKDIDEDKVSASIIKAAQTVSQILSKTN